MSDKANWVGTTEVDDGNVQHTGTHRFTGGSKFVIADATDATKTMVFNLSGLTTGTETEFTVPESDSSIMTLTAVQTATNKTFTAPTLNGGTWVATDSTFTIADNTTPTKIARFECSGLTAGTNVFTLPDTAADTIVTLATTQTLTSKTLTNPTVNAGSGVVVLPASASPAQTAEGSIVWDSDDDLLTVGDGSARKVMVDTTSTQTLTNKTLTAPALTAPTVATSLLVTSTTGAIGIPVMTAAQRDALTPAAGWIIFNDDTNKLNFYTGAGWEVITSA
jgi:hypothetical protein